MPPTSEVAKQAEVYEVRDVRAFVVDGVLVVWNDTTRTAMCTADGDACHHCSEVVVTVHGYGHL